MYERQIAIARELAAYANQFIPADPQRALKLAIYAAEATFRQHKSAIPAAVNELHDAVRLASRLPQIANSHHQLELDH